MSSIKRYDTDEALRLDLTDSLLQRIIRNYAEFLFGIVIGMTGLTLIMVFPLPLFLFFLVMDMVLFSLVLLKLTNKPNVKVQTNPKEKVENMVKEKRRGCPECGSSGRHKKNCGRSKEKK